MKLKNKIAIITGAANGIGLAISEGFAKEGAILFMGDVDESKCREEAGGLIATGATVHPVPCDVGKTEDVNQLIGAAMTIYDRIDILVNNAAVAIGGNIMEMPEKDWDELMNVNIKSIFRTVKAVLPFMIRQKSGSVINISSTQAFRSWKNWTAYAAAKGAMLSMTNQLAGQFGEYNIRFNTISPGAILTPMNAKRSKTEGPAFLAKSEQMHALLRMGKPEEVAAAAVFLASDDSGFVTGADLKVDGGLCTLPRYFE
ncbi:MAG: SDR family NAD(P)-dependent oxidoreductase [Chitinophagales bacterium]